LSLVSGSTMFIFLFLLICINPYLLHCNS